MSKNRLTKTCIFEFGHEGRCVNGFYHLGRAIFEGAAWQMVAQQYRVKVEAQLRLVSLEETLSCPPIPRWLHWSAAFSENEKRTRGWI